MVSKQSLSMQNLRNLAAGTLAALGLSLSLQAQCYEPLIGTSIGTGDDIVLASQAIGFAFPFAGTTYTDLHPATNGFVYLSNAGVPAPGAALCCAGTTAQLVLGSHRSEVAITPRVWTSDGARGSVASAPSW